MPGTDASRWWRWTLLAALAALPVDLRAEQPMSAIDWLSPSVAPPQPGVPTRQVPPLAWRPGDAAPRKDDLPPVAATGAVGPVTTLKLGETNPETLGLVPAAQAGLPDDLWMASRPEDAIALIASATGDGPPGVGALLRRLLIARLRPMPGATGQVFLARVDKLLDLGALDAAQGLLDAAGTGDADRFRRRFDVALLTGHEDRACDVVRQSPGIAPSLTVRIFCLARDGDWPAAMTTFAAARALGRIEGGSDELVLRFLEPAVADEAEPLPPDASATPLTYRMMEAIGEPMPTSGLPLAFAQADLSANTGWRAQLDAAERLARAGSLRADRLFAAYGDQQAAASGGIWDRVAAIAALDAALAAGDPASVGPALERAWDRLAEAGLLAALAEGYAPRLLPLADRLPGLGAERAAELGLMTGAAADWVAMPGAKTQPPLVLALAAPGAAPLPDTADGALAEAVLAGFAAETTPAQTEADLIGKGRRGEALLRALADLAEAGGGDPRRLTAGLATLRALGLEADARLIARQALILDAARH